MRIKHLAIIAWSVKQQSRTNFLRLASQLHHIRRLSYSTLYSTAFEDSSIIIIGTFLFSSQWYGTGGEAVLAHVDVPYASPQVINSTYRLVFESGVTSLTVLFSSRAACNRAPTLNKEQQQRYPAPHDKSSSQHGNQTALSIYGEISPMPFRYYSCQTTGTSFFISFDTTMLHFASTIAAAPPRQPREVGRRNH